MLKSNSRINLIRKRSAADKVYVPRSSRENQYILVAFKANLALRAQPLEHASIEGKETDFYRRLSHQFFNLCVQHNFDNVSFIAKNKLVRVKYAQEQQVIETAQQILFMYNPQVHKGWRTFFEDGLLADKIELLFLATGEELRHNAPIFHQRVSKLIDQFATLVSVDVGAFKIRDHQHLTYDVFAANKGDKKTTTHGFRVMSKRYQQQSLIVPGNNASMSFAVANLPITQGLLNRCEVDTSAPDPYNPIYTCVSDIFVKIAKQYNLNQLAMVANGKVPIIRQDNENYVLPNNEFLNLGFKPKGSGGIFVSQWDSKNLVDTIQLVFIASHSDINKRGYGRFVNHLTNALKQLCFELGYCPKTETVLMRFHQHLMYYLPRTSINYLNTIQDSNTM